jgi:hypothetical protein
MKTVTGVPASIMCNCILMVNFRCLKNVEMLLSQLKEHTDITVSAHILEDSESLEVKYSS